MVALCIARQSNRKVLAGSKAKRAVSNVGLCFQLYATMCVRHTLLACRSRTLRRTHQQLMHRCQTCQTRSDGHIVGCCVCRFASAALLSVFRSISDVQNVIERRVAQRFEPPGTPRCAGA